MPTEVEAWQLYEYYVERLPHFTDQVTSATATLLTDATPSLGFEDEVWRVYQIFLAQLTHFTAEVASGLAAALTGSVYRGTHGGIDLPTADARYLQLIGGTLTGPLFGEEFTTNAGDPVDPDHLARKQYVDDRIDLLPLDEFVTRRGDTMTGDLWVTNPVDGAGAIRISGSDEGGARIRLRKNNVGQWMIDADENFFRIINYTPDGAPKGVPFLIAPDNRSIFIRPQTGQDPIDDDDLVRRSWVFRGDPPLNPGLDGKVNRHGDTMTGFLQTTMVQIINSTDAVLRLSGPDASFVSFRGGGPALEPFWWLGMHRRIGQARADSLCVARFPDPTDITSGDVPLEIRYDTGDIIGGRFRTPNLPLDNNELANKEYVDRLVAIGTQHLLGVINASTGNCRYFPGLGFPDGPLIPPAQAGTGSYLICEVAGNNPEPMIVGDWLITDGVVWFVLHVGSAVGNASSIAVIPPVAGQDNVQDALEAIQGGVEALDAAKVNRTGDRMTGGLRFGSVAQATPTDLSRHIQLWEGNPGFGFSISSGTLNYVVQATTNQHDFHCGTNHVARLNNTELTMQGARDVRARNFITNADGAGVDFSGGAFLKKIVGTNMVIRTNTFQIEDLSPTAGANRRAILDANETTRVRKVGDTMTGALVIQGNGLITKINSDANNQRATLSFGAGANDHFHLYRNSGATALHLDRMSDAGVATNVFAINRATGEFSMLDGTMLTLTGPPTANLHAATKAYVDAIPNRLRPWTAGANYAVNDGVIYDNRIFRVLTAINNAPATPDFTTIIPVGYGQADYWHGNVVTTNWAVGNWVHICTVPAYGTYRVQISDLHSGQDTSLMLDIVTSWNTATATVVGYSHQGAGTWSTLRLSATGNGQPVRLELQLAAISGTPNLKITVGGETRGIVVNQVAIQKPPPALANGDTLGGTERALIRNLTLAALATSGDLLVGQGRFAKFHHTTPTDQNDGKIGTRLFSAGLNIIGVSTEATGETGRQVSMYGDLRFRGTTDSIFVPRGVHTTADNWGYETYAGGWFYKKSGTGMVIRCATGNTQPQIENNDGTGIRAIIDTVNGDARYVRRDGGTAPVSGAGACIDLIARTHIVWSQGADAGIGNDPPTLRANSNGIYNSNANYTGTLFLPALNYLGNGEPFYYQSDATFATTIRNTRTSLAANLSLNQGNTAVFIKNGSTNLWDYVGTIANGLIAQTTKFNALGNSFLMPTNRGTNGQWLASNGTGGTFWTSGSERADTIQVSVTQTLLDNNTPRMLFSTTMALPRSGNSRLLATVHLSFASGTFNQAEDFIFTLRPTSTGGIERRVPVRNPGANTSNFGGTSVALPFDVSGDNPTVQIWITKVAGPNVTVLGSTAGDLQSGVIIMDIGPR